MQTANISCSRFLRLFINATIIYIFILALLSYKLYYIINDINYIINDKYYKYYKLYYINCNNKYIYIFNYCKTHYLKLAIKLVFYMLTAHVKCSPPFFYGYSLMSLLHFLF